MTSEHFLEVKKCRVTPTPKEWGIPEISTCLRWSQGGGQIISDNCPTDNPINLISKYQPKKSYI
jgi:hypothetical protein